MSISKTESYALKRSQITLKWKKSILKIHLSFIIHWNLNKNHRVIRVSQLNIILNSLPIYLIIKCQSWNNFHVLRLSFRTVCKAQDSVCMTASQIDNVNIKCIFKNNYMSYKFQFISDLQKTNSLSIYGIECLHG
jgi:hypothetical protein